MTTQAAREIFQAAIAKAVDAEVVAKLELAREYFTNPAFRASMEQAMWERAQ